MRSLIKLENAFIFIIIIAVYFKLEFSIRLFLLLLLVPDIFMLGYVLDKKLGSYIYNIGHSYVIPILLTLLYLLLRKNIFLQISLIWLAHISMDRSIGYGLKYPNDFNKTTIQKV